MSPLLLALALPAAVAVAVVLLGERRRDAREAASLLGALALAWVVLAWLLPDVLAGREHVLEGPALIAGLPLRFRADRLALVYAGVAAALWLPSALFAAGYMRGHHEGHQTRFFACFALSIASAMGIAFSDDLLTMFVFYEALTLATWPLVTHRGGPAAARAGRLYLGLLLATSMVLLLLAIAGAWVHSGPAGARSLAFVRGGFLGDAPPAARAALFALFVLGIGKAALMPFHFWLPAAMVAPAPVSALLHAVAVVKAGVFCVLKVAVCVFGLDVVAVGVGHGWLLGLAAATIVVGSLVAMTRDNLKERLAYSTVSQLAYVVLGAALGSPVGALGAALHIVMHAFGKITLFFCAGAIDVATGRTRVSELRGLGRRMPWTLGAFTLGALSIVGLPPLGGAWSKWYLGQATLASDHPWLLGVLLLSSLMNTGYLLSIPALAFFGAPREEPGAGPPVREAPLACVAALVLTGAGSVALFFGIDPLVAALRPALEAP